MTPQKAVAIKCFLIGTGAFLSSLAQATLGSDLDVGEVIFALSSGFAVALGYAGISVSSNLEAVGKGGE
jgi:hypothetical protein